MVRMSEEIVEGEGHPNGKQDSYNGERFTGEGVASSLADDDAEVHGTLNDDDVGEGERKEKENDEGSDVYPLWNVLADVASLIERVEKQEEKGCQANAGSEVKNAEPTAGITRGLSNLPTQIEEEPRDGRETQNVFNYVDGAEIGNQPSNKSEVPHVAVEVEEICGGEE